MKESFLKIENLHVSVEDKEILKGLDLTINKSEIHVIMGPNGHGKSTLAAAIMGDHKYSVDKGNITYKNQNLLEQAVDERARNGIFLAMQYPSELSGVTNIQFLKRAINANRDEDNKIKTYDFYKQVKSASEELKISQDYLERFVNVGFSGGEKKRNEILQMKLLKPNLIILDEIDSGLDIDSIRIVGENIIDYYNENKEETSILIITHYPRLLQYIKPDYVHIIKDGVIVKTGDASLATDLETIGYENV